jgi:CRISPR-associated protein (TIGR02584 family)
MALHAPATRFAALASPCQPREAQPAAQIKCLSGSERAGARGATPGDPAGFPRRVLLAVSGLSPQIVTETLYALAVTATGSPRFVPTGIEIVTTAEGAERVRRHLLPPGGAFQRLCRDYAIEGIRFSEADIHVVKGSDGLPLADIRTADDNAQLADTIAARIRTLTADPHCALHVSLAGGRKTMGYYAGYALSLFGREQDRLSHVLVSEPFESAPEFWYPRPQPETLHVRGRGGATREVSTAQAKVSLALIPFVRLRQGLPRSLLEGRAGFAATVAAAGGAVAAPHLRLHLGTREVHADGQRIALQPAPFAFLVALASRALHGRPALPAPPKDAHDPAWAAEVLADLERAWGAMLVPDKIEASLLKDCSGSKVSPMVSRLRAALARGLAPGRLGLYFDDGGTHRHKRYAVPLGPGAIEICAADVPGSARRRRMGGFGKLAESPRRASGVNTHAAPGPLKPGDDG